VSNGGNYTKHIYMGGQRITSKVSNSGIFTTSPVTAIDLQAKYADQTSKIKERFDSLGVTYKGTPQIGGLVSGNPSTTASPYFYHSDHLGSSSLITDELGSIVQHLEYVPFGETFIDERKSQSSWTTPYLFSSKERDEETGLLYFGARYQDSKYGIWYSVDPLEEKYSNISSYVYCADNPVKFIDPDGKQIILGGPALNIGMGKVLATIINNSDLQDAYTLGSALFSPFTGNAPTRFEITTDNYGVFNGVNFYPVSSDDIEAAKSGLLMPVVSGGTVNKTEKAYYRYVGEGEKNVIEKTGEIPNINTEGKLKDIFFTDKEYKTAGKAKTHNQLPSKPSYKVEINPKDVNGKTDFKKVNPSDNPQWGKGKGREATTKNSIKVYPNKITRLK